jgi:hypothetical protein
LKSRSLFTDEVSNALFIPMVSQDECMGSLEVYRKVDSRGYDNGGFTHEEQIRLKNVT